MQRNTKYVTQQNHIPESYFDNNEIKKQNPFIEATPLVFLAIHYQNTERSIQRNMIIKQMALLFAHGANPGPIHPTQQHPLKLLNRKDLEKFLYFVHNELKDKRTIKGSEKDAILSLTGNDRTSRKYLSKAIDLYNQYNEVMTFTSPMKNEFHHIEEMIEEKFEFYLSKQIALQIINNMVADLSACLSTGRSNSVILMKLEDIVNDCLLNSAKVRHGMFAGQPNVHLREIKAAMAAIHNHDRTIIQSLQTISQIAKRMGDKHPILLEARRCLGLVSISSNKHEVTPRSPSPGFN
jgi:hypothetical protein